MINKIENLNLDDVVCLNGDEKFGTPLAEIKGKFQVSKTFEVEEFMDSIARLLNLSAEAITELEEGTPCRVMKTHQNGWKWGKVRLQIGLQFIPDELPTEEIIEHFDSPLDEIRKASKL